MRSLFRRLDPRARILTVVFAVAVISSTTRLSLPSFGAYVALSLVVMLSGRPSLAHLLLRGLAASPFILAASLVLVFRDGFGQPEMARGATAAITVAAKAYLAAFLLAFLSLTTTPLELLWALRRLRAPESVNLILAMMHRYAGIVAEEYRRMELARECRTVRPLGKQRYRILGRQLGALLLRSWDRAERVHAAMLSRGFTGEWPLLYRPSLGWRDVAFFVTFSLLFLGARYRL
ncbi:MAG: energy-coupling factor transporter transmembrane protein EcfT [Bryobacteraceae bacterium]|nr:energy-coupling factor transporter transmembrane protein EcfT [Bryobacteraceae bacterium]MDW8376553.1 energy-coupling factor transporter transmembrane component T [Bryobacterales bacterium]